MVNGKLPTLLVASVREFRVVDFPEDGLPTRPIRGSRGIVVARVSWVVEQYKSTFYRNADRISKLFGLSAPVDTVLLVIGDVIRYLTRDSVAHLSGRSVSSGA